MLCFFTSSIFLLANGFYNEDANKKECREMEGLVNLRVSLNCARRFYSLMEY